MNWVRGNGTASDWRALGFAARAILIGAGVPLVACPQLLDDSFPPVASGELDASSSLSDVRDASRPPAAGSPGLPDASADAEVAAAIDWSTCAFAAPERITGLGLNTGSQFGPALSADALSLVFSSTTGDDEDLFRATRADRGLLFSRATPIAELNTESLEGTPFLGGSGLRLYFQSDREDGLGGRDLYVAERAFPSAEFGDPQPLANINSPVNDQYPRLSPDELTLVFTSARTGGEGASDLWMASRTSQEDDFENVTPVRSINGATNDESGTLSSDGLHLFFDSDREGGLGGIDIYMATRTNAQAVFDQPVNLTVLNGSSIDFNVTVTRDERELFFASNRDGADFHVFRSALVCP